MKGKINGGLLLSGLMLFLLTACGGGGGNSSNNSDQNEKTPDAAVGDGIIPANNSKPATELEAARFLQKASFGPDRQSVQELMELGYSRWIDKQLNIPYQTQIMAEHPVSMALKSAGRSPVQSFEMGPYQTQYLKIRGYRDEGSMLNLNRVWLNKAINDPDQLKQRVAFALSQIMVTSTNHLQADAGMRYLDLLLKNSNATFRQLLEDVTLNPLMGDYLDMAGNAKAGTRKNSVADENYAREVLQLFSVGLYKLNTDGTRQQSSDGEFIDTYQQADVEEYARAFTGWSYPSSIRGFFHKGKVADLYNSMKFFPQYHDNGNISLLGGKTIAGSDGVESLRITLDSIAEHANVAPFISKQLIQKLVKSNPTPAYVGRVATIFNRSGGHIGITVKALLLDPESLNGEQQTIHKVKEPLLGYLQLLRATAAKPLSGKYPGRQEISFPLRSRFSQAPLQSPSVFNFFKPEYAPASFVRCEGSKTPGTPDCPVAPELQIYNDLSYISLMNTMQNKVLKYSKPGNRSSGHYRQNLHLNLNQIIDEKSDIIDYAEFIAALNKNIEIYILGHEMPIELNAQINKLQASELVSNNRRTVIRETLALVVGSPQFWMQR